jgi:NDP-sugar pyrophosphorylase family protein
MEVVILATVTAVRPPPRFGGFRLNGDVVTAFTDTPVEGWVNGGFFVLQPKVLDLIAGDATVFERDPLQTLTPNGQLAERPAFAIPWPSPPSVMSGRDAAWPDFLS